MSRRRTTLAVVGAAAALAGTLALAQSPDTSSDRGRERAQQPFDRVDASGTSSAWIRPDRRRSATVWAVGDGGDGGRAAAAVAALMRDADRVLYLGDVYDDGTAAEFRVFGRTFGRLTSRMAPTPGNHEWPNHEEGYEPYWRRVRGSPPPAYYAFRSAGWTLISLNSQIDHDADSPQLAWLRRQLRGRGTCRLAFWHRPRYSAGTTHGGQRDVEPFWQALEGRAALVLNGHEHNMQRFHPRRGLVQIVSGAGGYSRYGVRRDPRVAFADDDHDGALRLRLRPGRADFAFVAVGGRTLDSGSVRCRPR